MPHEELENGGESDKDSNIGISDSKSDDPTDNRSRKKMDIPNLTRLLPVYNPSKCPNGVDSCSSCNNLKALEFKLRNALDTVKQLLSEHYTQMTLVNHHHSSIIKMMPAEVMSAIFQYCAPSSIGDDNDDPAQSQYTFQLMTIAAVCKTWRRTAFSTPKLWTNVAFSLHRAEDKNRIAFAEEWLSRSGALPIRLRLYVYGLPASSLSIDHSRFQTWSPNSSDFHGLLDAIAKFSGRWQYISLCLQLESLQYLSDRVTAAPSLETIRLEIWDSDRLRDDVGNIMPDINLNFRFQLKSAMPQYVHVSTLNFQQLNIDWKRAKKVNAPLTIQESVKLLQNAPELESLVMTYRTLTNIADDNDDDGMPLTSPVVHTTLRSFAQLGPPFLHAPKILLPNLQHLTWKIRNEEGSSMLLEFIKNSTVALDSLELLSHAYLDYRIIAPSLYAASSITRLKFLAFNNIFKMTDFFLDLAEGQTSADSLSSQALRPIFLPGLQSVELINHKCMCDQGMEVAIKALSSTLRRLLKSCIIFQDNHCNHSGNCCGITKEICYKLADLVHAGTDIRRYHYQHVAIPDQQADVIKYITEFVGRNINSNWDLRQASVSISCSIEPFS